MGPVARGAQGAPGRGGRQRGHQQEGSRGARRGRGGRWKSRDAGEALASGWEAPAGGRRGGRGAAGGWDGVKSGFVFPIRISALLPILVGGCRGLMLSEVL